MRVGLNVSVRARSESESEVGHTPAWAETPRPLLHSSGSRRERRGLRRGSRGAHLPRFRPVCPAARGKSAASAADLTAACSTGTMMARARPQIASMTRRYEGEKSKPLLIPPSLSHASSSLCLSLCATAGESTDVVLACNYMPTPSHHDRQRNDVEGLSRAEKKQQRKRLSL